MPDEIDLFLEANKLDTTQKGLLTAYRDHLTKRGQYVEQGDLKKQFTEKVSVKDVNKVPIDITRCLVCGHEDFEVKVAL
jgi:uncharacterized protein with PIN domain